MPSSRRQIEAIRIAFEDSRAEPRTAPGRPLAEEPNGVVGAERANRGVRTVGRQGHRWQPPHDFTGDVEDLSTGGKDPDAAALARDLIDQLGALVDQMFTVVEYQQDGLVTQSFDQ